MSTISAGVGLITGLPIDDLVNSLIAIQRRPIVLLEQRLGTLMSRRTALLQISAQLLSIQNAAARFTDADFFHRARATSSNESAILATTTTSAAFGQYTFTVRNLASTHQVVSSGFATRDATLVGAGTLTFETAEALLDRPAPLSMLNGGAGVRAGRIHITDRAGAGVEIDLRAASTIDDVVNEINGQTEAAVTARAEGDHLVLEDQTGLPSGALVVSEVGGGDTATDLGLLVEEVDGVITGRDLVALSDDTRLEDLNDGNGVRVLKAQKDFRVTLADGTVLEFDLSGRLSIENRDNGNGTFTDLSTPLSVLNRGAGVPLGRVLVTNRAGATVEMDFSSAQTVRDIVTAPEWAEVDMGVTVSGAHLVITDNSTGDGSTEIQDVDGTTAEALGIAGSSTSGSLTGDDIFFVETVGDAMRIINTHADGGGSKLVASLSTTGPRLVLTDTTGGGPDQVFEVEALNGSHAAFDLGIAGSNADGTIESRRLLAGLNTALLRSLDGGRFGQLTLDRSLAVLNDGAGVPAGSISITTRAGEAIIVDLSAAATIGDVKAAIEAASPELTVSTLDTRLVITDNSDGDGDLIVGEVDGGGTAAALGLLGSSNSDTLIGESVFNALGEIQLTDRAGSGPVTVDLSSAETLADVIEAINAAPTAITASVAASGLGIQLVDTSGGGGNLIISDVSGTAATDLRIAGSVAAATVSSGNLQKQYISAATRLSSLNDGAGVPAGMFRITDSTGASAVVDLTQGNEVTLQDVIDEINSRGIGVIARINDTGDGLLLEDVAGGGGQLTVAEEGGVTTARALGILGTAAEGDTFLDGAFETRVTVSASDTLDDVLAKVQSSGARVNATIINDGSGDRPYRLSLMSTMSGRDGRMVLDAGATGLSFDTLMEARDATVLFGSPDADAPLVLTSSTNTITDAIPGVRLDLIGPSDEPVTITVSQDSGAITSDLSNFVSSFNAAIDLIDEHTFFDVDTEARGILNGDATARLVRQRLIGLVNRSLADLPPTMNRLSRVGINLVGGSSLQFDEQAFLEAFENDPDGVAELFTHEVLNADGETAITGFGGVIKDGIAVLTDDETGVIPIEEQAIEASSDLLSDRISHLEGLLERSRQRLLDEFYAMEMAIARLQTQQAALSQLTLLSQNQPNQF